MVKKLYLTYDISLDLVELTQKSTDITCNKYRFLENILYHTMNVKYQFETILVLTIQPCSYDPQHEYNMTSKMSTT